MDIIVCGFLAVSIISLIVLILMSYQTTTVIWLWLSLIITLNCLTIMSYFCNQEYLETIQMRCYQNIDANDCGGERATFFSFLSNLFMWIGIVYLVGILFFCRKVKENYLKIIFRFILEL